MYVHVHVAMSIYMYMYMYFGGLSGNRNTHTVYKYMYVHVHDLIIHEMLRKKADNGCIYEFWAILYLKVNGHYYIESLLTPDNCSIHVFGCVTNSNGTDTRIFAEGN